MILLIKEKKLGRGCASCRFLLNNKCMVDERVSVYHEGKIDKYRPYCCPFRYYDSEKRPVTKRFYGMTEEETKGYVEGMDTEHKMFIGLEEERDIYVETLSIRNADAGRDNE